jgi:aminomethyltransferase
MNTPDTLYDQAYSHAVLYSEHAHGRMFLRGRDRLALVQRLSTNDVEHVSSGHGTRTVFTTPIGRIIDVSTVYVLPDAALLITEEQQGPLVFGHLKKNIFFQDQLTLEPIGRSHAQYSLYGPQAANILSDLTIPIPDLSLHQHINIMIADVEVLLARALPLGGTGFRLLVPAPGAAQVEATLANLGVGLLDPATFDTLRIEAGYGMIGREHSQEYIPLETGLSDAISFTKGCYVGQEIIARMESRNRLAKMLRGLRLSAPVAAPVQLVVDGKPVGDLTSAVVSPRFGPIALAYLRTAYADPGTQVALSNSAVTAEVVELPFAG